jgi:hypothetical protein
VLRNFLAIMVVLLPLLSAAQKSQQPKVKVNLLNVCAPSADEQHEIASALARIPEQAAFSQDCEIDRGRSLLDQTPSFMQTGQSAPPAEAGTADWVRIRHDYAGQGFFATVQYSFSQDANSMIETLVFRVRDPKDLLEVAIEDSASAVTTPANMLAADTPVSRVKLERFGKSSIVLARCSGTENSPPPDQSAYEPLFQRASAVMNNYRGLLQVRQTVPEELARIAAGSGKLPVKARKPVPVRRPAPLNPN